KAGWCPEYDAAGRDAAAYSGHHPALTSGSRPTLIGVSGAAKGRPAPRATPVAVRMVRTKTASKSAGGDLVVWTVGHSTRALDAFLEILRGVGATLLIDVRTI